MQTRSEERAFPGWISPFPRRFLGVTVRGFGRCNCLAPCVLGISDMLTRYVGFFEGSLCANWHSQSSPEGFLGALLLRAP